MNMHILGNSLMTTVQDLGRTRYQKYGVNVSGAMDPYSLRTANRLTGNPENAAALEMTLMAPSVVFDGPSVIALAGADMNPSAGGIPVPMNRPVYLPEGTVLSFGRPRRGCRCYMAVSGGLDVPSVMGSRSTYARASLGGFQGRTLIKGDSLPVGKMPEKGKKLQNILEKQKRKTAWTPWSAGIYPICESFLFRPFRYTEGLQYSDFSEESRTALERNRYRVTVHADRMGYRLEGEKLHLAVQKEMISEMASLGTIQIPSEGYPIVLMAEHQTCAGYPEIGQIILPDTARAAQLKPGDTMTFEKISLEEAENIYIQTEKQMRAMTAGIDAHIEQGGL